MESLLALKQTKRYNLFILKMTVFYKVVYRHVRSMMGSLPTILGLLASKFQK